MKKKLNGAALREDLMVGAKSFIRNGTNKAESISRLDALNKTIGDPPLSLDELGAVYDAAYDAVTTPSCIRPLAECPIEPVGWLINDYIPAAEVTILAGDGGAGKSTLARDIITAVATPGKSSVFGDVNRKGKVLYYTAEDDAAKVVAGAMKQAGANLDNIGCLDAGHPMLSEYTFDSVLLENDIKKMRPALVVFDPLQAFLSDRINMSSRNNMRHAMEPLKQLAKQYDTTFLILMHTNKRQQVSGRARIADSSDIWDFARSVIIAGATGKQTEAGKNVRYASLEKANYAAAEEIPTVLFTVEDRQVHLCGTSYKKDADYVMAAATTERAAPKLEEAKRAIVDFIRVNGDEKGEVLTRELDRYLDNEAFSRSTAARAKHALKDADIIKFRAEGNGRSGGTKIWHTKLVGAGSDGYTYDAHKAVMTDVAAYQQNQLGPISQMAIATGDCQPAL